MVFQGKMALLSAINIVKIAELKIMAAILGAYICIYIGKVAFCYCS